MERGLKLYLIGSTVLMSPVVWMLSMHVTSKSCAIAILLGLLSGLVIGLVTKHYTSSSHVPETQKQSAATGIIYGLALGHLSCIVPVFCLTVTVRVAHKLYGRFGVALAPSARLGEDRAWRRPLCFCGCPSIAKPPSGLMRTSLRLSISPLARPLAFWPRSLGLTKPTPAHPQPGSGHLNRRRFKWPSGLAWEVVSSGRRFLSTYVLGPVVEFGMRLRYSLSQVSRHVAFGEKFGLPK